MTGEAGGSVCAEGGQRGLTRASLGLPSRGGAGLLVATLPPRFASLTWGKNR